MRRIFLVAAVLAGLSTQADAHAFLQSAVPRVGGSASAVSELRLTFTEALEPAFSTVTLSRSGGAPVSAPKAQPDPHDPKVLILKLAQPLPPGHYKVAWRVVSVDTHHTQGKYEFTVTP
jgi:copper resistance protein C